MPLSSTCTTLVQVISLDILANMTYHHLSFHLMFNVLLFLDYS